MAPCATDACGDDPTTLSFFKIAEDGQVPGDPTKWVQADLMTGAPYNVCNSGFTYALISDLLPVSHRSRSLLAFPTAPIFFAMRSSPFKMLLVGTQRVILRARRFSCLEDLRLPSPHLWLRLDPTLPSISPGAITRKPQAGMLTCTPIHQS